VAQRDFPTGTITFRRARDTTNDTKSGQFCVRHGLRREIVTAPIHAEQHDADDSSWECPLPDEGESAPVHGGCRAKGGSSDAVKTMG
jgi:hypothetical protein